MQPPGHIPGFHIPGTLTPIGAVAQEQQAKQAEAQRQRRNLLLLLR